MPDRCGDDFGRELRARCPKTMIVFVTGEALIDPLKATSTGLRITKQSGTAALRESIIASPVTKTIMVFGQCAEAPAQSSPQRSGIRTSKSCDVDVAGPEVGFRWAAAVVSRNVEARAVSAGPRAARGCRHDLR